LFKQAQIDRQQFGMKLQKSKLKQDSTIKPNESFHAAQSSSHPFLATTIRY
jgi:hypothetical protein